MKAELKAEQRTVAKCKRYQTHLKSELGEVQDRYQEAIRSSQNHQKTDESSEEEDSDDPNDI